MDPVVVPSKRTTAKHLIFEFKGARYYLSGEYYQSKHGDGDRYLHRVVWMEYHGHVPSGMHIHHVNHNRMDNRLENLECIEAFAHNSMHSGTPESRERSSRTIATAIKAAAEWRKSHPDRAKQIAKQGARAARKSRADGAVVEKRCDRCDSAYSCHEFEQTRAKFCSRKCVTAARVASGVDDVEAECARCGAAFVRNKYARKKYCSRDCVAE